MVVHPARGTPHSHGGERAPAPSRARRHGGDRPGLVHRLDKETSRLPGGGADRGGARRAPGRSSRRARSRRSTWRWCHGVPPDEGRLETALRAPPPRPEALHRPEGAAAPRGHRVARARALRRARRCVEVTLHTGRTHQIRVHLSEAGHPLLADATYGGHAARGAACPRTTRSASRPRRWGGRRSTLARLAFHHPRTGRRAGASRRRCRPTSSRAGDPPPGGRAPGAKAGAACHPPRPASLASGAALAAHVRARAAARTGRGTPLGAPRAPGGRPPAPPPARCPARGPGAAAPAAQRPSSDSTAARLARMGGAPARARAPHRAERRLAGPALRLELRGEVVERRRVFRRERRGAAVGVLALGGARGLGRWGRRGGVAGGAGSAGRALFVGEREAEEGPGARVVGMTRDGGAGEPFGVLALEAGAELERQRVRRRLGERLVNLGAQRGLALRRPLAPQREPDGVHLGGRDDLLAVANRRRDRHRAAGGFRASSRRSARIASRASGPFGRRGSYAGSAAAQAASGASPARSRRSSSSNASGRAWMSQWTRSQLEAYCSAGAPAARAPSHSSSSRTGIRTRRARSSRSGGGAPTTRAPAGWSSPSDSM